MFPKVLILLILVTHGISDTCVRYTFDDNYNGGIDNKFRGVCVSMSFWIVGKYNNLDLTGQNERSTSFITPQPQLSCISTLDFSMNSGGTIEVNVYMEAVDPTDQIIVLAYQSDITGDRVTGQAVNIAMDPNFVNGWHTLSIILTGAEAYDGYVTFMGMASPASIVLVDSFRYIPPGMDEKNCRLYEDHPIYPEYLLRVISKKNGRK